MAQAKKTMPAEWQRTFGWRQAEDALLHLRQGTLAVIGGGRATVGVAWLVTCTDIDDGWGIVPLDLEYFSPIAQ
ncbi:hypothetical protein, partial [Alcaligenes faecalis]|uniref:hypothetical protein n=1 Tax=Alcaligenes faecalis TaxID=511 RepID=UPI00214FF767